MAASYEVGIHGEALAALADKLLHQTKQAGRNRFFNPQNYPACLILCSRSRWA